MTSMLKALFVKNLAAMENAGTPSSLARLQPGPSLFDSESLRQFCSRSSTELIEKNTLLTPVSQSPERDTH